MQCTINFDVLTVPAIWYAFKWQSELRQMETSLTLLSSTTLTGVQTLPQPLAPDCPWTSCVTYSSGILKKNHSWKPLWSNKQFSQNCCWTKFKNVMLIESSITWNETGVARQHVLIVQTLVARLNPSALWSLELLLSFSTGGKWCDVYKCHQKIDSLLLA